MFVEINGEFLNLAQITTAHRNENTTITVKFSDGQTKNYHGDDRDAVNFLLTFHVAQTDAMLRAALAQNDSRIISPATQHRPF